MKIQIKFFSGHMRTILCVRTSRFFMPSHRPGQRPACLRHATGTLKRALEPLEPQIVSTSSSQESWYIFIAVIAKDCGSNQVWTCNQWINQSIEIRVFHVLDVGISSHFRASQTLGTASCPNLLPGARCTPMWQSGWLSNQSYGVLHMLTYVILHNSIYSYFEYICIYIYIDSLHDID